MARVWPSRPIVYHPAARLLLGCWLAAAAWLLAAGHGLLVAACAGMAAVVLLLCALTVRLTDDPPPTAAPAARERVRLWVQLALLAGVVVVTAWAGLRLHRAVAGRLYVPGWTVAVEWFGRLGERHLDPAWVGSPYNAAANPARYCLLPLCFLAPLTGFRHLGLGRGRGVLRGTALWCALPLAAAGWFLLTGGTTAAGFGRRLLSNMLQNGPFEEFLFRGAIQTRLTVLLGPAWGVALAALTFGVWHLGLGYAQTGGQSFASGLASTVLVQTVLGLGLGVVYHRTGNLVASSVSHVVMNSAA